ncbi:cysteine--1-D-myo-inosityl 2-amino-2-deoxy-alpha-D-glucopyranoside ligase [Corynebacterium sp. TAE3-ERU12]|uniref:cysteine--1-D-myo-inosityl 2-amino-2-deoxy-alpha-D-glucopyranoside ligase n=1 Tax=Corynebacterium sp. TAE3-ERU12 TaxID=2849491 RepID=UPI001C46664F|nr:cysteine--1-D-myo-inosityl 2-amino-2-deoxy-alpha-D-glucopyranoside ligase [Corynebacterium sp. TAE3-ERU12]MBV7295458.1 cysteine--1-D-myo-inosityl 2-amino-2-deoxy-alpha-D-glucopyranoside ligase [Corynebacterium sp. TAE3-ERU12]
MRSWPTPEVPAIPGAPVPLKLYDTARAGVHLVTPGPVAGLYVCGITPYDATHLGHAATYVAFDIIHRVLLANGHDVHYVQNITDVDDPLFERAERDGVDWRELGDSQIELFRSDMDNLDVIPPRDYIGAIEAVPEVIEMVSQLLANGSAYQLEGDDYADIYFRRDATKQFGYESNYDEATMSTFFAERGGDPDRPGKRDPLDALLWRAARPGEPSWEAPFGAGRPGWHIECSAIARNRLGVPFDIQGGGSDLIFPHHEFSAAHAEAAADAPRMALHYVHTGMISLDGTKMSKSLGNLVFVSKLTAAGHDPAAIRLGILASHYRQDRPWSDQVLAEAEHRLSRWREAVANPGAPAAPAVVELREALANDIDTPTALAVVDRWAARSGHERVDTADGQLMADAVRGLLGVNVGMPNETTWG